MTDVFVDETLDVFAPEHAAGGVVDDVSKWMHDTLGASASEKPTEVQKAQELVGRGHQLSPEVGAKVAAAVGLPPASGKEADDRCKALLPSFICEGRTPGLGDVPWWVWAVIGTGVVGFGALSYVSYKAAPYVLPVAIPESAPFVRAWQQARGISTNEDKQKVAEDTLAALVAAQRGQTPAQDFGLVALKARQDQAGRELRSMIPVRE